MATPIDASRVGTNITTAAGSWAINIPTVIAGDIIFMYIRVPSNTQIGTPPSGYTQLHGLSDDASDDWNYIYVKLRDGTEGGTVTVTPDASSKAAAISWRIAGAADPSIIAPEIVTPVISTAANVDPPSITPTGGPKDFLYIILGGEDGETQTFVHGNYDNITNANSGTGGSATSNCRVGGGTRAVTGSTTENPGSWAVAAPGSGATAFTIAIHPPPPAIPGPVHRRYRRADRFLTMR